MVRTYLLALAMLAAGSFAANTQTLEAGSKWIAVGGEGGFGFTPRILTIDAVNPDGSFSGTFHAITSSDPPCETAKVIGNRIGNKIWFYVPFHFCVDGAASIYFRDIEVDALITERFRFGKSFMPGVPFTNDNVLNFEEVSTKAVISHVTSTFKKRVD